MINRTFRTYQEPKKRKLFSGNFSENYKTAEVGCDLNPKFQAKGIMSEALKAVIEMGFKGFKLDKIEAFTHRDNESSKKLLEKNGFSFIENRTGLDNEANRIFELENFGG